MDIPSLFMIPSAVSSGKVHSVFPNSTDADFDFNRDSDATRVNSEGLIERVGYYSAELITPEANTDFSSNTGYWTLETGVTIENGKVNFTEAANNRSFYKGGLITNGKTYKLQITISGYVQGFIDSNNGNNFTFPSSNGTHTVYFVGGNPFLVLGANGTTTLSIDNISLKEVTGDRARLNYEIEGGLVNTKPSLLLEPQSTNLITYSDNFSQWVVDGQASISSDSIISPDGTRNSDKLIAGTTSARQSIKLSRSYTGNLAFSIFAKKGEYSVIQLTDAQNGSAFANFNLETGAVGSTGVYTASMVDMGNDWYRCIITWNASVAIVAVRVGIVTTPTSARVEQFAGNGINGLYIYGAQLEQQSYATSYIPTNGSTQTRAAETCNGAGTSSIFESSEGILFYEFKTNNTGLVSVTLFGSDNDKILIYGNTGNSIVFRIRVGGSYVYTHTKVGLDLKNTQKAALFFKNNNVKAYVNGVLVNSSTSAAITYSANTLASLNLDDATINDFYGKIRDIRVYNTKEMTDSEVDILLTKITS